MITALDATTALVLIDLQQGIAQGDTAHPLTEVVRNAAALVEAFHAKRLPVVVVNVDPTGAAWTRSRKEVPTPAGPFPPGFTDIIPEIDVRPGDIRITKHTWNAFHATALHDELQRLKVTGIVLAGIATSIGVEGTARAASERAYTLTFATDAMTDRALAAHEHSVVRIFPRLGECGTTEEVLRLLA